MAAASEMEIKEDRLKSSEPFNTNAWKIIEEMVHLAPEHPSVLVDEVLHSIFFLGKINFPPYRPEEMVSDADMLKELMKHYPRPFECYSSQLPKRSPFSCVLDMIVNKKGQQNEIEIITSLKDLRSQMEAPVKGKKPLVSSTICVSQIPNSVRYYGVSMSTSGPNPGQIIVAASCLNTWDRYVAGAVMTYFPEETGFNETFTLPKHVSCKAFSLVSGLEKPPCKSCSNLFGLTTDEKKDTWSYGNCAEVESVSNLLKNERDVRKQVGATAGMSTDIDRTDAEARVSAKLLQILQMLKFKLDKKKYYTPLTSVV